MLSAEALEAVREAVESPAGPDVEDFRASRRQPRQQHQHQQRRRQQSGGRDATPSSGAAGRSHQSQPRTRGGRAAAADDERAARGEVGEYAPGGSVELGMFGKRLVSFGQVNLVKYKYHAFVGCAGGEGRGRDGALVQVQVTLFQFKFVCSERGRASSRYSRGDST